MIDPGRLNTRLVVQAPVETPDGQGGVARSYITLASTWASLTPRAATPGLDADANGATVSYRVVMRAGFGLTCEHRLIDGPRLFIITAIRVSADRRFTEIDAELRAD
jgi:head-tail adaptor